MSSSIHIFLLCLLCLASVQGQQYTVLHRVLHAALDDPPFSERGVLTLAPSGHAFVPATDFTSDLEYILREASADTDASYQIALQRPPAAPGTEPGLDISSVKACYLQASTSDLIGVHLDAEGSPYSLDYFVSGVPSDGKCPGKLSKAHLSTLLANTSVVVHRPTFPPLPELRVPPPVTPEGQPVVPVPEKTFLQKYWIYIAIAVVGVLFTGGPPPEGQGAPAPSQ